MVEKRICCNITLREDLNLFENICENTLYTLSKSICCNECRPNFCHKYISNNNSEYYKCDGCCPLYMAMCPFLLVSDICISPCKLFLYCENCCQKKEKNISEDKVITKQPTTSN
jgi:hypothetical protein